MKQIEKTIKRSRLMKMLLLTLILAQAPTTYGQSGKTTLTRPFQLTFISPLGTNGLQSAQVSNVFSLNLISGYAGGVNGLEIGGVSNSIKGNMHGVQVAGVANTVKGTAQGVQISGTANIVASEVNAVQIAGAANVAFAEVKGAQISGCVNYSQARIEGLQLGVVNISRNIKGAQIGVINIADTIEKGVAFGVLSFVKNGYKAIEIGGNETMHGMFSFKTGTYRLYNIISIGNSLGKEQTWAFGYGFGTLMHLNKKMDIDIEITSFNIIEDGKWAEKVNMVNKMGANISYHMAEKLLIFGGLSWNVAVSDMKDSEGETSGSSLIPWYSLNHTNKDINIKQYAGFNFGVRMVL